MTKNAILLHGIEHNQQILHLTWLAQGVHFAVVYKNRILLIYKTLSRGGFWFVGLELKNEANEIPLYSGYHYQGAIHEDVCKSPASWPK